MRNTFRYGAAVGIIAAAFGTLGPVAAQASETPGTCAGACGIDTSVGHIATAFDKSLVLRNGGCDTQLWGNVIGRGLDRKCEFRSYGEYNHFRHSRDYDGYGHSRDYDGYGHSRDYDGYGHSEFSHSSHYSQVSYHARVLDY